MPSKNIKVKTIKRAPPPSVVPIYGSANPKNTTFIGKTNYASALEEKRFIFGIKRDDRENHIYIIGRDDTDKSKLLEAMMRQDIFYGYGLCLIDFYGETIKSLLNFVPEKRVEDVVFINPADKDYTISLNPLCNTDAEFSYQITREFINLFERLFRENWTSNMEYIVRLTLLALLDYPEANMLGVMKMLTDRNYRLGVSKFIKDKAVKNFWLEEFDKWSNKFEKDTIIPLTNKLSSFIFNPFFKGIFSQTENKIDFEKFISEKRIVLISLPKSQLGEEAASFLGSIFSMQISNAGVKKYISSGAGYNDFYIYINEFTNIADKKFESMLLEYRKYGLPITMSHQYAGQLPKSEYSFILNNVGNIIVFRVGIDDATRLKSEMFPVFDAKDIVNLGPKDFYIKMTIDGEIYDPFSAETLNLFPAQHKSFKEEIVDNSLKHYYIKT